MIVKVGEAKNMTMHPFALMAHDPEKLTIGLAPTGGGRFSEMITLDRNPGYHAPEIMTIIAAQSCVANSCLADRAAS